MFELEPAFADALEHEDLQVEAPVPGRRALTASLRRRRAVAVDTADDGVDARRRGRDSGARELSLDAADAAGAGHGGALRVGEGDHTSLEALRARARAIALPAELRAALERAHGVALEAVRLWHAPELAARGLRGLSAGHDVLVADASDLDTIAHELGHVIDGAHGAAPVEVDAFLAGLHFAHDPGREARADRLAAAAGRTDGAGERVRGHAGARAAGRGARVVERLHPSAHDPARGWEPSSMFAPVGPATLAPLGPPTTAVAQARVADGARVTAAPGVDRRGPQGAFLEEPTRGPTGSPRRDPGGEGHPVRSPSSGLTAPGVTPELDLAPPIHGQLAELTAVLVPALVVRRAEPPPPRHPHGHAGAFVLPAALCGGAAEANLVYLPARLVPELAAWQARVTAFARRVPGRFHAEASYAADGLASRLTVEFACLDPVTGMTTGTRLSWSPELPADRAAWSEEVSGDRTSVSETRTTRGLVDALAARASAGLADALATAGGAAPELAVLARAIRNLDGAPPARRTEAALAWAELLATLAAREPEAVAAVRALVDAG